MRIVSTSIESKKVVATTKLFITGTDTFKINIELDDSPISLVFAQEHTTQYGTPRLIPGTSVGNEMHYVLQNCNWERFVSDFVKFATSTGEENKLYSFRVGAIAMNDSRDISSIWLYIFNFYEEMLPNEPEESQD